MENLTQKEVYAKLCEAKTKAEYKKAVQNVPLSKALKMRFKEVL